MHYNALLLGAAMLSVTATASQATVTYFSDLASWQSSVGKNFETTVYGAENNTISSITLNYGSGAGLTLNVSPNPTILDIPSDWGTWCCSYKGQVLWTGGGSSFTFTLLPGEKTRGIGFYAEPDLFSTYSVTLAADNGASLTELVNGDAGAQFFGFSAPAGTVTSFTISSGDDFAVGDFFAAVPELSTWAMTFIGFAGLGCVAFRGSRKNFAIVE
jgi:hypothetical protein